MSIETQSYYYLLDPFVQFENNAGKPIVAGHIEVYKSGTDEKVITLQDFDGTENPFKIPLGSDGRATILVDIGYTYDAYVYDSFNNLACSRLNIIPLTDGDITVQGLTKVYHDETLKGQGTATDPLSVADGAQSTVSVSAPLTGNGAPETPVGLDTDKFIIKDIYGNATMYDSKGNQVALTVNNTTNENEAHIHVESKYEDCSYWWAEIDGADGGFIQQNWYDTSGTSAREHLAITRSDIYWGVFDEDNNFTRTYSVKDEIGNKTSKSDFYFDENGVCQSVYGKPFAASWANEANEANKAYKDGNGDDIASTYTKKSDFDTWTDEGRTYVTGLDGNAFNAHWANYATHDENGNVITESYAGKSDFVFDKDNHLYTVSGKEIWAAGANYAAKSDSATNAFSASKADSASEAAIAGRALNDNDGNNITTTYVNKNSLLYWYDADNNRYSLTGVNKGGGYTADILANWSEYAGSAEHATNATNAYKSNRDDLGRIISNTYQTKLTDYSPATWNTVTAKANISDFGFNEFDKCTTISGRQIDANWANYATHDEQGNVITDTYQTKLTDYNPSLWNTVSDKLDTTAFSNVSGTFLTAHQSLDGYAKTADLTAYYPITGGNLKGSIAASGAGSTSNQQTGVVYAKITNTTQSNRAGLSTNGSVLAGDYGSTTSQTIGVRRKISDTSAMAGRFQLYSDGNVSFQQVSNNGTADSIVCQLQYGQTTTGFNWGTMTSGTTVKHIAYTEDIPSVPVIGTIEV